MNGGQHAQFSQKAFVLKHGTKKINFEKEYLRFHLYLMHSHIKLDILDLNAYNTFFSLEKKSIVTLPVTYTTIT